VLVSSERINTSPTLWLSITTGAGAKARFAGMQHIIISLLHSSYLNLMCITVMCTCLQAAPGHKQPQEKKKPSHGISFLQETA
jgi:hypothetical protein